MAKLLSGDFRYEWRTEGHQRVLVLMAGDYAFARFIETPVTNNQAERLIFEKHANFIVEAANFYLRMTEEIGPTELQKRVMAAIKNTGEYVETRPPDNPVNLCSRCHLNPIDRSTGLDICHNCSENSW